VSGYATMQIAIDEKLLKQIPATGSLLVVANRVNGIDGELYLYQILEKVRSDFKVLVNSKITVSDADERFVRLDPKVDLMNLPVPPLKNCQEWLKEKHALAYLPGKEAKGNKLLFQPQSEKSWSKLVARMVKQTDAVVIPIFFLQPSQAGEVSEIRIGKPIDALQYQAFQKDCVLSEYLRLRTYLLRYQGLEEDVESEKLTTRLLRPFTMSKLTASEKIIDPISTERLESDLNSLSAQEFLVESEGFQVYLMQMKQAPSILKEIGRLREVTFREVGEGTGKKIDIDKFDRYYHHLVVWNPEKKEIVGAYRVGLAKEIMAEYGKKFLYTSTLFKYRAKFIKQMGFALEMGRSFVRKEYQENFGAFKSLWKGIGAFIVRYPQYKIMFGPVSISNDYKVISRELMVKFLEYNHSDLETNEKIRPRVPLKTSIHKLLNRKMEAEIFRSIGDVNYLLADIEETHHDMPPLLKQYLTLGGRLEAFNVDPEFNNALDGLIVVDVSQTSRRMLQFYLGKEGSEKFVNYHEAQDLYNLDVY